MLNVRNVGDAAAGRGRACRLGSARPGTPLAAMPKRATLAYRLAGQAPAAGTTLRVPHWMSQKNEMPTLKYVCDATLKRTSLAARNNQSSPHASQLHGNTLSLPVYFRRNRYANEW